MRPTFYDNIISDHSQNLMADISKELSHLEQEKILEMIEEIFHHRILAVVLEELPIAYHEHFLVKFQTDPNDIELFSFLKFHSPIIEEKIAEVVLFVVDDLKKDFLANRDDFSELFSE